MNKIVKINPTSFKFVTFSIFIDGELVDHKNWILYMKLKFNAHLLVAMKLNNV